jgi:AraC-like DNA-binding protein
MLIPDEAHLLTLGELSALSEQLAPSESPEPIISRRLAAASGFSARSVVMLNAFAVERPLLVSVLSGTKRFRYGELEVVGERGDVLVLPAGLEVQVASYPDENGQRFRAFIVELDPAASSALCARHPDLCVSAQLGAFSVERPHALRANATALQAMLHFARTLLVENTPPSLLRHRMEDLLLSLSLQHASGRERAVSDDGDIVLAVRQLLRQQLDAELSSELVARKLAVSPATLRRRLAAAGVTLRDLRAEERMALARTLLAKPGAQVAEVALRCGYRSPSKFAKQFQRFSGELPGRRTSVRAG